MTCAHLTSAGRACPPLVGIGLALAILLSGCGTSGATTSSPAASAPVSTAGTGATTTGSTSTGAGSTRDDRIARAATLRLSDFPSGWEADSDSDDSAPEPLCQTLHRAHAAGSAYAESPKFTSHTAYASSEVILFADAATATNSFDGLTSRATGECVGEQLGRFVAETHGVTIGQITTAGVSISRIGNQAAAERLTIPVSQNGVTIRAFGDVVYVRVGRAIAVIKLVRVLSRFGRGLETELVKAATGRLADGLRRAP